MPWARAARASEAGTRVDCTRAAAPQVSKTSAIVDTGTSLLVAPKSDYARLLKMLGLEQGGGAAGKEGGFGGGGDGGDGGSADGGQVALAGLDHAPRARMHMCILMCMARAWHVCRWRSTARRSTSCRR